MRRGGGGELALVRLGVGTWAQGKASQENDAEGLVIYPQELPATYPRGAYQVEFHARGDYVPVLHWRVESGELPPGLTLDDNGVLRGEAQRAGEFQFAVSVRER